MQQTDIGFIYFGIIKMNIYFDYGGGEMMKIHLYIRSSTLIPILKVTFFMVQLSRFTQSDRIWLTFYFNIQKILWTFGNTSVKEQKFLTYLSVFSSSKR